MSHSSSPRRRRRRCRIIQRVKFAGHASPDAGTNVREVAKYLEDFAGPNAVAVCHKHMAAFVRYRMRCDDIADYYLFSINTTVPGATQFINGSRQACERATMRLFPGFSKSHPDRHDPNLSIGVIVLPAVSASGRFHCHGWIRIPRGASQTRRRLWIDEDNKEKIIDAPEALVEFVMELIGVPDAPFRQRRGYLTSLWIANRDGQAVSTQVDGFGMGYLLNRADHELRKWTEVEFIPKRVLAHVGLAGRARRDARARQLKEMRRWPNAA